MKAATRDLLTGLTAIVGLAGLVLMLFLFGELKDIGRERYEFILRMETARGLSATSPVTLSGVPIGAVVDIRTRPDPAKGVDVVLRIDEEVRIPREFTVYIDRGLVGDSTLELSPDPDQDLARDGGYIRPGEIVERQGIGTIEQIARRLEEPIRALGGAAEDFEELAATYNEVGRRINSLLEPRTPDDVDAGEPATVPSTLARLDGALAGAHAWLADEELRQRTREVVDRADAVLTEAERTARSWDQAAQDLRGTAAAADERLREATTSLVETLHAARETLAEFRAMAVSINEGRGTAGMLVTNPDLYLALNDAVERLEKMLLEAQLTFEKIRKEGLPVQY